MSLGDAPQRRFMGVRTWWKGVQEKRAGRIATGVLKWTGIVLLGFWLLYVAGVNILLATQFAKTQANAKPQSAQVDYASAWTLFPGRFHASGIKAYGQFTGFQYYAEVDDVFVRVSLLSLLSSRIVVENVELTGVTFHGKTVPGTGPNDPPINPPIALDPAQAPPVPFLDESLSKYTLEVADLDVEEGRELWMDGIRYIGPADAHGAVVATPNRALTVNDFRIDLLQGMVVVGDWPALPYLVGDIDVKLELTDPRKLMALETVRNASMHIDMAGSLADLRFAGQLGVPLPVPIGGRGGKFRVDVAVDHGKVVAPGEFDLAITGAWTQLMSMGAGARLDVHAAIRDATEGPTARVDARVSYAEVTSPDGHILVSVPNVLADATATKMDLANPSQMLMVFAAHVPKAVVPDATRLNSLLSDQGVTIQKGIVIAKVDLEGSMPSGYLKGNASFGSDPITGVAKDIAFQGKLTGSVPFLRPSSQNDIALSGTSVKLENTNLDYGTSHTKDWWVLVTIPKGNVRTAPQPMYIGNVHAEFRDLDPVMTAVAALHGVPEWFHKVLGLGPYVVDGTGVFGSHIKLDMLDARTHSEGVIGHPNARMRVMYDDTKKPERMKAAVSFGVLALGVQKVGGDIGVQLADVDAWFAQGLPSAR